MRGREAIIAAARRCVGVRFRAHGRDPAWGLDCVGLAALAFGRSVAADYPLRGGSVGKVIEAAAAAGLRRVTSPGAGDLVLLAAGAGQLHLAILTERGFVHADVGLRRVVETPGAPPWPVLAAWAEGE